MSFDPRRYLTGVTKQQDYPSFMNCFFVRSLINTDADACVISMHLTARAPFRQHRREWTREQSIFVDIYYRSRSEVFASRVSCGLSGQRCKSWLWASFFPAPRQAGLSRLSCLVFVFGDKCHHSTGKALLRSRQSRQDASFVTALTPEGVGSINRYNEFVES